VVAEGYTSSQTTKRICNSLKISTEPKVSMASSLYGLYNAATAFPDSNRKWDCGTGGL
jgi:hypothetical protein